MTGLVSVIPIDKDRDAGAVVIEIAGISPAMTGGNSGFV
jgi:hypothetical protein